MKKRDIVLIIVIIAISALGIVFETAGRRSGSEAYIYTDGKLYGRYDLSEDTHIHIENANGIVNDIAISDNSIYMENATCPGRQCMACGRISHDNESICCAPAGLLITVSSEEEPEYDAVTK